MNEPHSELTRTIARATNALASRQHVGGYWEGRLASSPLATAVGLCALADDPDAKIDRAAAAEFLRKTQNADGGWGDTEISKSNLAATLLTLCANQSSIVNRPSSILSDAQRTRAEAFVEKLGGLREGLRRVYGKDLTFQVPIRMTAACAGLLPWNEVDVLPFELALAPRGLMGALRLPVVSYALPALVCVGLSRHGKAPSWLLPLRWLRESLADRALNQILKMQPKSGGYLEATPITAFCLLGLKAAGRADHPVAKNARRFLIETQRTDGSWPVEVHLSVWNTTRAIDAVGPGVLMTGGLCETDLERTRDWLLGQQVKGIHAYTDTQPGGWGWNHLDGSVPDADDTSGAILALRRLGVETKDPAFAAGKRWLLDLQNRDGGWPTFCRGWQKLPFDRSAPDLTAHALRALQALGETTLPQYRAGWEYLRNVQRKDGSFAPLWFGCETAADELNATYGTTHVLFACEGDAQYGKTIRTPALTWLRSIQNADGGFGGCKGAPSTAEETGLALRALVAGGAEAQDEACARAAKWLMDRQRADGSWDAAPIGFYFAVLWYHEEMYPLCYALGGLKAWAAAQDVRAGRNEASRSRLEPVGQV